MTDRPTASRGVRRLATAVCGALWIASLVATHVPISHLPDLPTGDKTLHGAGYFVLAGVFAVTLLLHGLSPRRRSTTVLIVMALYGAFDEITQPLAGRSASWGDWLADIIGSLAAVMVCETARLAWRRLGPRAKDA